MDGIIGDNMRFVSFKDFCTHCESIKQAYNDLSIREKRIYRMYVYSDRFLSEKLADKIWEYLNEPFGSVYYVSKEMLFSYM